MLTQATLRELLDYDPLTGIFKWRVSTPFRRPDRIAGTRSTLGYVKITISDKRYSAHRLAFLWMVGAIPTNDVDHVNGIRDDNRWVNLRSATRSENLQNVAVRSDNQSGFVGVSIRANGKWVAQIAIDRKKHHLGIFDTPDAAHEAYISAKAELHTFNPDIRSTQTHECFLRPKTFARSDEKLLTYLAVAK